MSVKRKIQILFVVLTFLCFSLSSTFCIKFPVVAYTSHAPIFIHNNAEFHSTASANGWSGNGLSEDTRYIIDDLSIINDVMELFSIESTTVWFEIRNCYFDNIDPGTYNLDAIYLRNVQNGIIFNNTIENSRHGIFLDSGCSNIVIDDNSIEDTSESGIRLNNSDFIEILENEISNSDYHAIWINQSSNNLIDGNTLSDCYNGIWIRDQSSSNNVTNNNIVGTFNGICVSNSSNDNNLYFNVVNQTEYGIVILDQSTNTDIVNNTIIDCIDYGIVLDDSTFSNTIFSNSLVDNNLGGTSQAADNGTNNDFTSNYWNEWTTPDINMDGIVDDPYLLDGSSGNSDSQSTTTPSNPIGVHFLTPASFIFPLGGETVNQTIQILWTAAYDFFDHPILYNLSYRYNTSLWFTIDAEMSDSYKYWNTTSVGDGTGYQLKVVAYCSMGLTEESYSGYFTIEHTKTGPELPPKDPYLWLYIVGGVVGATAIAVTVSLLVFRNKKRTQG